MARSGRRAQDHLSRHTARGRRPVRGGRGPVHLGRLLQAATDDRSAGSRTGGRRLTMAFKGGSAAAVEFFEALEADNSKTFWHAHKPMYEHEVKRPMEELLDELSKEFGEGKIFRPNRDVR